MKHTQNYYRLLKQEGSKYHCHENMKGASKSYAHSVSVMFGIKAEPAWFQPVPAKYFRPVFDDPNTLDVCETFPVEFTSHAPGWFVDLTEGVQVSGLSEESIHSIISNYELVNRRDYLILNQTPKVLCLSKSKADDGVLHSELLFRCATITENKVSHTFDSERVNVFRFLENIKHDSPKAREILEYFEHPDNQTVKEQFFDSAVAISYLPSYVSKPIESDILDLASRRYAELVAHRKKFPIEWSINDLIMVESGDVLIVGVNEHRLDITVVFSLIRTVYGQTSSCLIKLPKHYHDI